MFHFIYKTTNTINGHYYIGKHSTDNIHDGYFGSGTWIKNAVKQWGREYFKTEIIKYAKTEEEAYKFEAEIVTSKIVNDMNSYNLIIGGEGGVCSYSESGYKRAEKEGKIKEYFERIIERKEEESKQIEKKISQCENGRRMVAIYKGVKINDMEEYPEKDFDAARVMFNMVKSSVWFQKFGHSGHPKTWRDIEDVVMFQQKHFNYDKEREF